MRSKLKSVALGLMAGILLGIVLGATAGSMVVWLSTGIVCGVLFMAAAQKVSKSVGN